MPSDIKRPPLRIQWRSRLAEWLHRLAKRVAPASGEKAASGGAPPEHWLAMLRERAPHLLEPGAMSSHFSAGHIAQPRNLQSPFGESDAAHRTTFAKSPVRGGAGKPPDVFAAVGAAPTRPGDQPPRTQTADPDGFQQPREHHSSGPLRFFADSHRWNVPQGTVSYQSDACLADLVKKHQSAELHAAGCIPFAQRSSAPDVKEDSKAVLYDSRQSRPGTGLSDSPDPVSKLHSSLDLVCKGATGQLPASQSGDTERNATYSAQAPFWPVLPDEPEARIPMHLDGDRPSPGVPPGARDPGPKRDDVNRFARDFKLYCEQQGMPWNGFPF